MTARMSLPAEITFAARTHQIDRASHMRPLAGELLQHRRAVMLPLWRGKLLIQRAPDRAPELGWTPPLRSHLSQADGSPLFLGMSGETPCFAADFSDLSEDRVTAMFRTAGDFTDLRDVAAELLPSSATIAATAKAVLSWHATHRFCALCGKRTEPEDGGWRRRCISCGALHFPRIDPVVIMLVVKDGMALLCRQESWPEGLYSLPAGFMEPGETLEDAVRRETREETAVQVGRVRYIACQPWPFPTNLMIGCVAEALTEKITVDPTELEDAQWVSRTKLQVVLAGQHPRMAAPKPDAIASVLLNRWVAGTLNEE